MPVLRHRRRGRASRRRVRLANAGAATAALLVAVTVVWHAAWAGFSASTPTGTLGITTGTVSLGVDAVGAAVFDARDLEPGATETRCVVVTSTSSVPTVVRFYGTNRAASSLAGYLQLSVSAGTGGGPGGACTGFRSTATVYSGTLSGFTAAGYASGVGSWATTGTAGETRSFRLTYSLPSGTSASAQGTAAAITFVWEAQTA